MARCCRTSSTPGCAAALTSGAAGGSPLPSCPRPAAAPAPAGGAARDTGGPPRPAAAGFRGEVPGPHGPTGAGPAGGTGAGACCACCAGVADRLGGRYGRGWNCPEGRPMAIEGLGERQPGPPLPAGALGTTKAAGAAGAGLLSGAGAARAGATRLACCTTRGAAAAGAAAGAANAAAAGLCRAALRASNPGQTSSTYQL